MLNEKMSHKRTLGLVETFSIASGAMISSGLFILPAVLYAQVGSAVVSIYFLAGLMMIPSIMSKAELSTAMPKSGGTYFFVERSLGTLLGTFAGFAGWFSIALKGAFSLVGIGAFWSFISPDASPSTYKFIACICVIIFTLINLSGTHGSARSQVYMVMILLAILVGYILLGGLRIRSIGMPDLIPRKFTGLLPMVGMVFVSFGGLTKVAAVAHDIKNPGKLLPRSMFLSFFVVMIVYILGTGVTVALLDPEVLKNTLTPFSLGGDILAGRPGAIALSIAALIAFATTANAAILSASQNPAAMADDGLLPSWMGRKNAKGVPVPAVLLTGGFMIMVILGLNLSNLVKAASTMKLILFLLVNLSVILMRESRIVSYRPQYRAPFYPVLPILGVLLCVMLIYVMGVMPLILSTGFFLLTTIWTLLYCRDRPQRDSALLHVVERLVNRDFRSVHLAEELGEILRERDGVAEDRFDALIRKAIILDLPKSIDRNALFEKLAGAFSLRLETDYQDILRKLHEREAESTTLVSDNLAIPHLILDDEDGFEIVIVRAREGISYEEGKTSPSVIFALAGARSERNFHLQCLMAIAQITRSKDFIERWNRAVDEEELRILVALAERTRK